MHPPSAVAPAIPAEAPVTVVAEPYQRPLVPELGARPSATAAPLPRRRATIRSPPVAHAGAPAPVAYLWPLGRLTPAPVARARLLGRPSKPVTFAASETGLKTDPVSAKVAPRKEPRLAPRLSTPSSGEATSLRTRVRSAPIPLPQLVYALGSPCCPFRPPPKPLE